MNREKVRRPDKLSYGDEWPRDAAFARVQCHLAARRRRDLQLALASAVASWVTVAVLVARAREAEDAKAARRLERERARAQDELLAVLHRVDDEVSDLETGELIDALLNAETLADTLLGEP
jgi:hypothetical protein